jgi:tetratricopeptide (TPR) repeat protein
MTESNSKSTDENAHGAMDQFTAHIDRGWDLIHRGDLRGAQISAEKSLELDAHSPEAYNLLGFVKAAQGDAEDALENYRQAIALDDTFVEAMLNAAEVLIHPLHDFDAALGMVEEALDFAESDDETADALLIKYDAYMHQGDKDGAARVVTTLPNGPFESPRLDFLVGRAHFETGHTAEAKPLLLRAVEREPENGDAHYTLALVHEASGDTAAMIEAFLRTRETDLAAPPVHWTMGRASFAERLRVALDRLPVPMRAVLASAQLVVAELPGPEVVADGIDPRLPVLLDAVQRTGAKHKPSKVARVFVYQRNVERAAEEPAALDDELYFALEDELCGMFPDLARYASEPDPDESHDH